jgi:hypothetical protein
VHSSAPDEWLACKCVYISSIKRPPTLFSLYALHAAPSNPAREQRRPARLQRVAREWKWTMAEVAGERPLNANFLTWKNDRAWQKFTNVSSLCASPLIFSLSISAYACGAADGGAKNRAKWNLSPKRPVRALTRNSKLQTEKESRGGSLMFAKVKGESTLLTAQKIFNQDLCRMYQNDG